MPDAWSDKAERMYAHIKQSELDRGRSQADAERIAAARVNAWRREHGRTESGRKTTTGTGNPHTRLEDRSKQQLYNRAKELDVDGRSKMTKSELVDAIREHD